MAADFHVMLDTVREYCRVIESIGEDNNEDWLQQVFTLLPQLHAAIAVQLGNEGKNGKPIDANLEIRFELFSKLHKLLGEKDAYWMEFDLGQGDNHKSGSLADDLTDIYCELKHGLALLEKKEDPGRILGNWRQGYRVHWGRHLVDAERHLYELSAKNQLGGA